VQVDLNSDLGEGFGRWTLGDDDALLGIVTSANIACGFHAGDPSIMRRVCRRAAANKVSIGAQVGYRDLAGFGRRHIDIDPDELSAELIYQVGALDAFARAAGSTVSYVKPHGALYNTTVHDERQAAAVVSAVRTIGAVISDTGSLAVLTLPGSALGRLAADAGIPVVTEAFVDRGYRADGTLIPRTEAGAILHDLDEIVARAVAFVKDGAAESLCVHGDTAGAVDMAIAVRSALLNAGVTLSPFVAQ
jgi:UPF0271 protein